MRVHYPGVWLSERVWATHGHYLDRHLLPEVAYGIARGLLGRLPRDGATPADYEQAGGPSITRLEALLTHRLPRPLAALWDDLVEVLRAATMPGIPRRLLGRRIAPVTAMLLGAQARRASIPALGRVVHRLGVDAEAVIGARPLPAGCSLVTIRRRGGDPVAGPQLADTAVRRFMTVSPWIAPSRSPDPPAGAILLEVVRDPQPYGLLDQLDAAVLQIERDPSMVSRSASVTCWQTRRPVACGLDSPGRAE